MHTEIVTLSGDWSDEPALYARLHDAVARTLAWLEPEFGDDTELSIALSDDAHVQALNREFRQIDRPTNVLAFPGAGAGGPMDKKIPGRLLGDIILASGVVAGEAARDGKAFSDHVVHLTIHGLLHLLGYGHDNEADAKSMEALEVEILKAMDISDPYNGEPGEVAPGAVGYQEQSERI
jgi:probable rRNA maturation factor